MNVGMTKMVLAAISSEPQIKCMNTEIHDELNFGMKFFHDILSFICSAIRKI